MRCPKCKKQLREGAKFCPACGARVKKRQGRWVVAVLLVIILLLGVIAGGLAIGIFAAKHFGSSKSALKISNVEEAIAHAKELGEELGYENAMSEMTEKVTTEIDGDCYYRLQQNYQGIPVYGRTAVYVSDEGGNIASITGNVLDVNGGVDLTPTATHAQIISAVQTYCAKALGVENVVNIEVEEFQNQDLCIYISDNGSKSHLVYRVRAGWVEFLVDAHNAEVLFYDSLLRSDTVTGSLQGQLQSYDKITYFQEEGNSYLNDSEKGIETYYIINRSEGGYNIWDHPEMLTWSKTESPSTAAVDAYVNTQIVYDYFAKELQNVSVDGAGKAEICICVGVEDIRFKNGEIENYTKNSAGGVEVNEQGILEAQLWFNLENDDYISYSAFLDVVAHEYMHCVEKCHSGMVGGGECGAIKEGLSDIFGELVWAWYWEKDPDWIGDVGGEDIRDFSNPGNNSLPAAMHDEHWENPYDLSSDNGYVHHNSTVISHAAYLMWHGINDDASKKIDTNNLAKLWYRAMLMMPSDCDFIECRTLVELAASTMNLTDLQKQCVCEAFDTVGIPRASEEERSQLVHFVANGKTSIKGTIYEVKTVDGIEMVVPVPKATMTVYSDNSTKVYEKLNMKDENGFFEIELHAGTYSVAITAEGYIGQTISFELFDNEVRYFSIELKPSNNNLGNNSDSYNAYLNAAQKTTEAGSWSERLDLTANMAITDGNTKTKTKMVMTSDADISNYSERDPSRVRMSGAAEMSVMGQTYAWNMQYENGIAHYQYIKPNQTSADMAIDPSFFNFGTMTSDMMSKAKMSGNQITFTVPGDKITEVGIAAVNQLSGVDDLNYDDVDVTVTISNEGTIDTITMVFHASLKYQGYDADVDYNIVYHFSQSTTGSNNSSVSIVPCSYTNVENKYDILSVHEVNGNQIVFSIWWYKIWDIPEATATLNGNVASFHYIDPVYSTIQAKGTIEFLDGEAILTISECSNPNIHNDPYCFAFLSEKLSDQQLKEIRRSLGVPDDLNVTIKQGTPGYWEGGSRYRTEVSIFYNGELIAGASVDSLTGDIAGSIYMYSGHTESTSGTLTISETDAYDIACEYWDYTENKVDDETGYQLILSSDGLTEDRNGKKYYAFRLRWFVPTSGHASTLEYLYVDAETGEYKYSIDY